MTIQQESNEELNKMEEDNNGVALETSLAKKTPEEFRQDVADAEIKANDLQSLINRIAQKNFQSRWAIDIKGSLHLKTEAWQAIGDAYGLKGMIPEKPGIVDLGNGGFAAYAVVVNPLTGAQYGGAWSECGSPGDDNWTTNHSDMHKKSMAQTRAISRAFKQILSWVVVLAGYDPTPYDEMPKEGFQNRNTTVVDSTAVEKDDRETEPCPLHLGEYWTKRNSPNSRDADKTNWSHPWKPEWCNIGASIVLNECVQLALTIGYTPQGIEKWINEATDGRTLDGMSKTEMIEVLRKMRQEAANGI
jgi:hypothetical protein